MLTQQEKIDEIYNYIKKKQSQEKFRFFIKIIFYIALMVYFLYMYFILVPEYTEKYKLKNIFEKIKTTFQNLGDSKQINIGEIIEKKSISSEDKAKLKEKLKNILRKNNIKKSDEQNF